MVNSNFIKKNIGLNFIYRIVSLLISFIVVTISVRYLGHTLYGLWATILSMLTWINYFDVGIGNGLRNKLSESISKNLKIEARDYISTGYFSISIISIFLIFLFGISFLFIDWSYVFNTKINSMQLLAIMQLNLVTIAMVFILKIITSIYYAFQSSSTIGLIQLINQILVLLGLYILDFYDVQNRVLAISIVYGLSGILSNSFFTYVFFKSHHSLRPKIQYIKRNRMKDITGLGLKFFVIQLAALIIFSTDNLIITRIFGPEEVTLYDIAFKVFSIITFTHGIIITPIWSAVTKALAEQNFSIIRTWLRRLQILQVIVVISAVVIIFIFPFIVRLWINEEVKASVDLLVCLGMYVIISTWSNNYAYIFNGLGEVNYQLVLSILAAILNIPLAIYLAKYLEMGVAGVVLSTNICLFFGAVTYHFKMNEILMKKEKMSNV